MKLTQSRAIPLVILVAISAALIATFLFRDQFVFGHEDPEGCDISSVGLSARIFDANGSAITEVSHGMQISYGIILSIPELPSGETACNYGGGKLAITLPNGTVTEVAGVDGTPDIPLVERGSVYEAPSVSYTVDQNDAQNLVLTIRADYSDGRSHRVGTDAEHEVASAALASQIIMMPPRIQVAVSPEEQVVYEGGDADFRVTINNTGGLDLSNIQVSDSLDTACERTVGSLAVGGTTTFDCEMSPAAQGINAVTATADVVGGVPADLATVSDTTSVSITLEALSISVDMTPRLQRVRLGNPATFEITVLNPNTTGLVNVSVTVPEASECDRDIGALASDESVTYNCTSTLASGTTLVTATAQGEVVDVSTLTDSSEVEVVVFELALAIDVSPNEQIIREGTAANFTVKVSNYGNTELTDVSVTDDLTRDCSRPLGTLESQGEVTYDCSSNPLPAETEFVIHVTGTAPDDAPVEDRDTVVVRTLRPSTVVDISEVDTMVFRLVVHVLTITETNNGNSPLDNVYVDVEPANVRLTADSREFIGGDSLSDGVLSPGETWVWRLVTVSVAGDGVMLDGDAEEVNFRAIGHGTDPLGEDITFPAFATEMDSLVVPISGS